MIELVASVPDGGVQPQVFPRYLGEERCEPGHEYGRIREHYLVHYVVTGRGEFRSSHHAVRPAAGTIFLVRPGEEHWYRSSTADPWTYRWVGFTAPPPEVLAPWLQLSAIPSVIPLATEARAAFSHTYRRLWRLVETAPAVPALALSEALMGLLRTFLNRPSVPMSLNGTRAADSGTPDDLDDGGGGPPIWQRVRAFLDAHFAEPIQVTTICRSVGISRAQLHRLSVAHLGHGPKVELTRRRMARAIELLRRDSLPVARIAPLVGYREYQTFERQFRRYFGRSPSAYRAQPAPSDPTAGE